MVGGESLVNSCSFVGFFFLLLFIFTLTCFTLFFLLYLVFFLLILCFVLVKTCVSLGPFYQLPNPDFSQCKRALGQLLLYLNVLYK